MRRDRLIHAKWLLHEWVKIFYKPKVEKRRKTDEMEILADMTDFFTQKPTICNKKLEGQLREICRKIETIHSLMFAKKIKLRVDWDLRGVPGLPRVDNNGGPR